MSTGFSIYTMQETNLVECHVRRSQVRYISGPSCSHYMRSEYCLADDCYTVENGYNICDLIQCTHVTLSGKVRLISF